MRPGSSSSSTNGSCLRCITRINYNTTSSSGSSSSGSSSSGSSGSRTGNRGTGVVRYSSSNSMCSSSSSRSCVVSSCSSRAYNCSSSFCMIRAKFCPGSSSSSTAVSWRSGQATSFLSRRYARQKPPLVAAVAASFSTFSGPEYLALGCTYTRSGLLRTTSSISFFSGESPYSLALRACCSCCAAAGAVCASAAAGRLRQRGAAPVSAAGDAPSAATTAGTAAPAAAAEATAPAPPAAGAAKVAHGKAAAAAHGEAAAAHASGAETENKTVSGETAAATLRRRMQSRAAAFFLSNTADRVTGVGRRARGRAAARREVAARGCGAAAAAARTSGCEFPLQRQHTFSASASAAGFLLPVNVELLQRQQQRLRLSPAAAVSRRGLTTAAASPRAAATAAAVRAAAVINGVSGVAAGHTGRAGGAAAAAAAAKEAAESDRQQEEEVAAEQCEMVSQPRPLFLRYAVSQQQLLQHVLPLLQSTDAVFLTDLLLSLHALPYLWPAVAAAAAFRSCHIVTPLLSRSPSSGAGSSSSDHGRSVGSNSSSNMGSNSSSGTEGRQSDRASATTSAAASAAAASCRIDIRNWGAARTVTAAGTAASGPAGTVATATAAIAGGGEIDRACGGRSSSNYDIPGGGGPYYREYMNRLGIDEQHVVSLIAALRNGRDLQLLLLLSLLPAAAAGPARPCRPLLISGGFFAAAAEPTRREGPSAAVAAGGERGGGPAAGETASSSTPGATFFTAAPGRAGEAATSSLAENTGEAETAEEEATAKTAHTSSNNTSSKTHAADLWGGRLQQQRQVDEKEEQQLQSDKDEEEQQQENKQRQQEKPNQQERQRQQKEERQMLSFAVTDCLPVLLAAFHPQSPAAQWDVVELLLLHITRAALSFKKQTKCSTAAPAAAPPHTSSSFPSPLPSPLSIPAAASSAARAPAACPSPAGIHLRAAVPLSPSAAAAPPLSASSFSAAAAVSPSPAAAALHSPSPPLPLTDAFMQRYPPAGAAAPPPFSPLPPSAAAAFGAQPMTAPAHLLFASAGPSSVDAVAASSASAAAAAQAFVSSCSSFSFSSSSAAAASALRPELGLWLQHVALCLSPHALRFNPRLPLHLAAALQAASVPLPVFPAALFCPSFSSFLCSSSSSAAAAAVMAPGCPPGGPASSLLSCSSPAAAVARNNPSFSSAAVAFPWPLRKAASSSPPCAAPLLPPVHHAQQQQHRFHGLQQQHHQQEQQHQQQQLHAAAAATTGNKRSDWVMPWDIVRHVGSVALLHQLHIVQPYIWNNIKWDSLSAETASCFFRDVFDSAHVELSALAMERAFVAVQQKFFLLQLPDVENLLHGIHSLQLLTQKEKQRLACSSAALLAPLWPHVHRLLPAASTKLLIFAAEVFSHEVFVASAHASGAAHLQAHAFGDLARECQKQRPNAAVFAEGGVWWEELLQLLFSRAYFWSLEEWVAVFRLLEPLVVVQQLQQAGLYGAAALASPFASSSSSARPFVPPPPLVSKVLALLCAAFGGPQQHKRSDGLLFFEDAAAPATSGPSSSKNNNSSSSNFAEGADRLRPQQQQSGSPAQLPRQHRRHEEEEEEQQQRRRREKILQLLKRRDSEERHAFRQQLRLISADCLVDLLVGFTTYGYCNAPLQQLAAEELVERMQQQLRQRNPLPAAALCRLLSVVQALQQQEQQASPCSNNSSSSALLDVVVKHVKLLQLDRTETEQLLALAVALSQQPSVGLSFLLDFRKQINRRLAAQLSPSLPVDFSAPTAAAAGEAARGSASGLHGTDERRGGEKEAADAAAAAGECVSLPLLPLLLFYIFSQQANFAHTAAAPLPLAAAAAVPLNSRNGSIPTPFSPPFCSSSSVHSNSGIPSSSSVHSCSNLLSPLTSSVRQLVSELLSLSLSPLDALLLLSPLCAVPSLSALSPRCFPPASHPLLLAPPLAAATPAAAAPAAASTGAAGKAEEAAAAERRQEAEEGGDVATWRSSSNSSRYSSRWWWCWGGGSSRRCEQEEKNRGSSNIERTLAATRARLRNLCHLASQEKPYSPLAMLRVAAAHALQQTYEKQLLLLHAPQSNQRQISFISSSPYSTILHVPLLVRLLRLLHMEEDPAAVRQLFDLLSVADLSSFTPQLLLDLLTAITVARLRFDAVLSRLCSWYCDHLQQEEEKQQQQQEVQQQEQQQEPGLPGAAADALLAEVLLQLSALNYVHEPLVAAALSRCCAALLSPSDEAAAGGGRRAGTGAAATTAGAPLQPRTSSRGGKVEATTAAADIQTPEGEAEEIATTRTCLRLLFGIFSLTTSFTSELASCFRTCAQRVCADVRRARRREAECTGAAGDEALRCTYTAEEFRWLYEMYLRLLLKAPSSSSFQLEHDDPQLQHFLLSDLPRQKWVEREKQQREAFLMGSDFPQIAAALRRADLQRMQPLITGICFCHFASPLSTTAPAATAAGSNSHRVKGVALLCVEEQDSLAAWTVQDEAATPLCVGEGQRLVFRASKYRGSSSNSSSTTSSVSSSSSPYRFFLSSATSPAASAAETGPAAAAGCLAAGGNAPAAVASGRGGGEGKTAVAAAASREGSSFTQAMQALPFGEAQRKINQLQTAGWVVIPLFLQQWRELQTDEERDEFLRAITSVC